MTSQLLGKKRGRRMYGALWAGALLGLTAFLSVGCDSGSDGGFNPPRDQAWHYESEFLSDPGLLARADQVVILDVSSGVGESEHSIPYQDESGGLYLFAVESDDPFISRIEVFDSAERLLGIAEKGDGGLYIDLLPGGYLLKAYHQGSKVRPEGSVAFIRRQTQGQAPLLPAEFPADTGTSPIDPEYPAYVALQFAAGAYAGQYLAAIPGSVWEDLHAVDVRLFKAVPLATSGDEFQSRSHLFSFQKKEDGDCDNGDYPPFEGSYALRSWPAEDAGQALTYLSYACNWSVHCPPSQTKFPISGWTSMPGFHPHEDPLALSIQENEDGTFTPWLYAYYALPCSPVYAAENGYGYFTEFSQSAAADSLKIDSTFMFYKDGSQINRGDLKKLQVALYEGEGYTGAAVVLNSSFSDTTLIPMNRVKSVAFGLYTDTTISFFSQTGFSGSTKTVGVDMPANLDLAPGDMRSIKVFDSYKILASSKKCPHCNLAGVDLSSKDLHGADLTTANLMQAILHYTNLKNANLSNALLSGAHLTNANLSGASLLGASLNSNKALNLSGATLTGAYLKNVNCKGADLGGAEFSGASFHTGAINYHSSGCAQDGNNPPFTMNCTSAVDANMDNTQFNDAYLAGSDFSGATANGANFSGSVLTGAIFKGTHLDWDSGTGASTNFSGAFIGGADFTNATVEGANFESAYVNLSTNFKDYSIYFSILSDHTQFYGFDNQYGDTPCVWFVYSGPTVVPQTSSGNTCPDGDPGPCGDTAWSSPVAPRDQSPWQNSKVQEKQDWCAQVDYGW